MRHVIFISAAFPPTGGPGVQRSLKFVKYLPMWGWSPIVWSAPSLDGLPYDDTLLHDIPASVAVHRFPRPDKPVQRRAATSSDPWWQRIGRSLRVRPRGMSEHPDSLMDWARASLPQVLRIISEQSVDAIYSTFSPASNHWLAMQVKTATNLPWVADFRDLWTDDYRYAPHNGVQRNADLALEREILDCAEAVIGVSPRQTSILASHARRTAERFFTIYNGYDPDDFRGVRRQRPVDGDWVLAHVGRLDRWRALPAWFDGLRAFLDHDPNARSRCVLRVVGHASTAMREKLATTGARCDLHGYQSHGAAIQHLHDADALLLPVPEGPNADSVIPAKLFEYLASKRPALVVGPVGGECEGIVRRCQAGITVPFESMRVAEGLRTLFEEWKRLPASTQGTDPVPVEFSRPAQAQRLVAILERVSAVAAPRTAPRVERVHAPRERVPIIGQEADPRGI